MTSILELARRAARLRALLLVALATVFGACDATDRLTSTSDPADTPEIPTTPTDVSLATTFRGGIPFGYFAMPTTLLGADYNGAHRNIWPGSLLSELRAIKGRGSKVVLMFAGNAKYYKTDGKFSFTKWKERVARYRGVNFSSYVNDGTIVAHYLIDEPNDPRNWGNPIPGSTLEAMAKYSKTLWPGLPTVVRTDASYLAKFSTSYHYLDAAWAQFVYRKGPASDYISQNVNYAKKKGLALITGLNVTRGGPNGSAMTPTMIKNYGSALLASTYPCAFISWIYKSTYASSSSVKDAMRYLSSKARNRDTKSCRG